MGGYGWQRVYQFVIHVKKVQLALHVEWLDPQQVVEVPGERGVVWHHIGHHACGLKVLAREGLDVSELHDAHRLARDEAGLLSRARADQKVTAVVGLPGAALDGLAFERYEVCPERPEG